MISYILYDTNYMGKVYGISSCPYSINKIIHSIENSDKAMLEIWCEDRRLFVCALDNLKEYTAQDIIKMRDDALDSCNISMRDINKDNVNYSNERDYLQSEIDIIAKHFDDISTSYSIKELYSDRQDLFEHFYKTGVIIVVAEDMETDIKDELEDKILSLFNASYKDCYDSSLEEHLIVLILNDDEKVLYFNGKTFAGELYRLR